MAILTVQKISGGAASLSGAALKYAGLIPVAAVAAAAGGDEFANDGRTYFECINGGAGTIIVTVDQVNPDSQGKTFDPQVDLAAGVTKVFGPFEKQFFDDANGRVKMSYSGVTTVTVRAFSLAERFAG